MPQSYLRIVFLLFLWLLASNWSKIAATLFGFDKKNPVLQGRTTFKKLISKHNIHPRQGAYSKEWTNKRHYNNKTYDHVRFSTVTISSLSKQPFQLNKCLENFCIYFVYMNQKPGFIGPVVACAVYSAAVKNPEATVILQFENPEISIPEKLAHLSNVYPVQINQRELFEGLNGMKTYYQHARRSPEYTW